MKNFFTVLFFIFFIYSSSQAQRILLSQGFENGPYTVDSLPVKWSKVKVIPSTCPGPPAADWRARDSGSAFCGTNPIPAYNSKAYNTRRSLCIPWTSGGATLCDDWVFTDSLRIATGDSLIFWVQLGSYPAGGTYYLDSLQIWITSGQTPASQIQRLETVTSLPAASNFWQEKKYDLSAYNGQRVYVAFRYYMNVSVDGIMANVDSVMVRNLSSAPPACNYSWSSQSAGTTNPLSTVSTVSNEVAWAGGAGPTVVRTTNGTTWTSATGTGITGPVYCMWAVSATECLVGTYPGNGTFIYKTTNGGTTWTQVFFQSGAAAFLNGIQMISATEGYAMGDPVAAKWMILKTTDGGNSWARMATEPVNATGEAGWNNSFQILGTNIWFGTNQTRVWRSTDLGLTWSNAPTTGSLNTFAVHYNNSTNGLAAGVALVKSSNGGANYTAGTSPGTTGSINGLEGHESNWWAIRTGTTIYRSTDFAQTWSNAHVQTGAAFADIDFKIIGGCPVGWAVGSGGNVAKLALTTGINPISSEIPTDYNLDQNYPNPFNPSTNINFSLPKSGLVTLKIYDMVGREVTTLVNEFKNAGSYVVGFNASNLTSGTYFYRIESNDFIATKKMLLVK